MHLQSAEIAAALLAAIAQMRADENQAALGATNNQLPVTGTLFNPPEIKHLATVRARHDLMRTSDNIAWPTSASPQWLVKQALSFGRSSGRFHPTIYQINSFFGSGYGWVIVAIVLLALLLHLFNVLGVRRIWTRESLATIIAASAAVFLIVGVFMEMSLE
jgi:hypothetical protein